MKGIAFTLGIVLLAATQGAFSTSYSVVTTISEIETVDTTGASRVFLTFGSAPHTTNCSLAVGQQWRIGGVADNQRNLIAIAVAARLADRPVKVLFVDTYAGSASCDGGGTNGYPVVSGLIMQ